MMTKVEVKFIIQKLLKLFDKYEYYNNFSEDISNKIYNDDGMLYINFYKKNLIEDCPRQLAQINISNNTKDLSLDIWKTAINICKFTIHTTFTSDKFTIFNLDSYVKIENSIKNQLDDIRLLQCEIKKAKIISRLKNMEKDFE